MRADFLGVPVDLIELKETIRRPEPAVGQIEMPLLGEARSE